ncbi:MAG TPA: endo-1,4-beta-xylanase [Terriglobia bacterium]|nr:endo-1,4-beta-xylanase [Terriglobia bacterium]
MKWTSLALLMAALVIGLSPMFAEKGSGAPVAPGSDTLRAYADKLGFHIGSIMQMKILDDPRYRDTLTREFNLFVSFVFMRFVEPAPGQFNFRGMDQDMQFAREHQMKLFGASLIYRAGAVAPAWLAPARTGNWGRSKDEYDSILREWIQTVVRHGGDSYYCWEVVNEPLSNPNQPWQAVFGRDEYIAKAFRYAREANPNVALELNETFGQAGVDRAKTDEFFDLVERLKSQGVPIDIVGTEMHLEAQQLRPTYLDELRYFLSRARAAHVQVYISEMDLYQGPPGAFPDPMEHQRKIYHDVLATCLADSNCKGFNTWGVSDARSWLTQKVMNPRPDAKPLLFDERYQKKPAYFGVLQALQERAKRGE